MTRIELLTARLKLLAEIAQTAIDLMDEIDALDEDLEDDELEAVCDDDGVTPPVWNVVYDA